jgi:hypothetical protein
VPKQAATVDTDERKWLNTDDLVELAEKNAIVLVYKTRRLEDFPGSNGPVPKILADLLIVAPTSRAGELWPDQDFINAGITNKLVGEPDNTAVAGRLERKEKGRTKYPVMNPTQGSEWKAIEDVYKTHKVDIDAPDADEQLFAKLRAAHESNARAAGNGKPAVDDGDPPF